MAKRRTVTVSGVGTVRTAPDVLTLSLGVQVRGSTAREALSQANERTQSAIAALKEGGVADRDLATTNISIWPQYGNDGRRVEAYQAQNTLTVRLRQVGEAGSLLDRVAGLVGDDIVINGISFAVDEPEGHLSEARAAAMASARAKADQLAAAAGAEVGKVVAIVEGGGGGGWTPYPKAARLALAAAESVPIEAGETELSVSVSVTYRLTG
jgi:uncharacterized protein YggE